MNTNPERPLADVTERCRAAGADWSRLPVRDRLGPVRRLRHLLASKADALAAAVERDVGRPPQEVLATDILPTADACRFLETDAARLLRPRRVPGSRRPVWMVGQSDTVHRRPHGVVGVIGTWNYPVFLNGVQLVQALTAGNGVVWKPSELTPATAEVLAGLFAEAGFPAGLLSVLPATREGGPRLAEADVDHVVFTGSAEVGRRLAARLGERLVSSTLELSGCDALFVLADADVALAAKAAWFGATINRGQTCLAVRRAFVHRSQYDRFLDALRPLAEAAGPLPLVMPSQAAQAGRLVEDAVGKGARLLGGPPGTGEPATFRPAVLADATPEMAACREAAFAPIVSVLPFDTAEEAWALHRRCAYGLGASVFTADPAAAEAWAARLAVGVVTVNDVIAPTAHPATPFGGRGASGWGVTQGDDGLLAMTVPQVVSRKSGTSRPHYGLSAGDPGAEAAMRGLLAWQHGATFGERCGGLWRLLRNARALMK